ncbi:hypothetical protein SEVIR_4G132800v4 [Setaria viridis]
MFFQRNRGVLVESRRWIMRHIQALEPCVLAEDEDVLVLVGVAGDWDGGRRRREAGYGVWSCVV